MEVPANLGSTWLALAAASIPLVYVSAAWLAPRAGPFLAAEVAAVIALGASLCVGAGWFALGGGDRIVASLTTHENPWLRLRFDAVTAVVLLLVTFLAFVIARFSRAYLAGEPGVSRYVRSLLATLAAVTTLVISNNLLVIAGAWMATSLCLHRLLTFYADRPQAVIAAHKKFLVSRVADLCVLSAFAILGAQVRSLDLDGLELWLSHTQDLPRPVAVASVLLVLGAALKSAQLPVHGWLIQVMEAPTPVSALLHAGVVNLGGFLMIRLAPLMSVAPAAQMLLVVIGSLTALVAALVAMTRVSIKVNLAWSTCAQMGFMLVQCGLGAYHLALLHLVAHSLYKAHAFLSAGSTVASHRVRALGEEPPRSSLGAHLSAGLAGMSITAGAVWVAGVDLQREPALWAIGLVLSLSLAPLLVNLRGTGMALLSGGAVILLYFTWHALVGSLAPANVHDELLFWRVGFAIGAFGALFLLQSLLLSRPRGRIARALHPWLFAGLYLDEWLTALTFRIWPPRPPVSQPTRVSVRKVFGSQEG